MKKIFTILVAVLLTANVIAQAPQKMSYQAVIRNSSNALVTSTGVGMQISILQGSPTGTPVYTETQTPITNANGLVSIEIGGGTGFNTINWSAGPYFIKTETDPTGGTTYTITGTSQLLSVPYALHAKTAESTTETDPIFVASPASGIASTDITNWNTAYGWGNHAGLYWPLADTGVNKELAAYYTTNVELVSKAPIASPTFTGRVTMPFLLVNDSARVKGSLGVGRTNAPNGFFYNAPSRSIMDVRDTFNIGSSLASSYANGISLDLMWNPAHDSQVEVYGMNGNIRTPSSSNKHFAGLYGLDMTVEHHGSGLCDIVHGLTGTASLGSYYDSTGSDVPYAIGADLKSQNYTTHQIHYAYGSRNTASNLSSGSILLAKATYNWLRNLGSGTIDSAMSSYNLIRNTGGGTINVGHTVHVANPQNTGSILTKNVGLYIENQTAGTNNWAIYSAGGLNYFGGDVYTSKVNIATLIHCTPLAAAPSPASEGDLYAGTNHHLYYYNGSAWKQLDN